MTIDIPNGNRRKYERAKAQFAVRYRIKDDENMEWKLSEIGDISQAGLLLFTSENEIMPGTILEMKLFLHFIPYPIDVKAKVIWNKLSDNKKSYNNGVNFIDIKEEDKKNIAKLVDMFNKKK